MRVTYKVALSDSDSKFGKDTVVAGDHSYASISQKNVIRIRHHLWNSWWYLSLCMVHKRGITCNQEFSSISLTVTTSSLM